MKILRQLAKSRSFSGMRVTNPVAAVPEKTVLVYAGKGNKKGAETECRNPYREREQIKEWLKPWVNELVQKQMKAEREYYKSRPGLAAKQFGSLIRPEYMQTAFMSALSRSVYDRLEEKLHEEKIRKGR